MNFVRKTIGEHTYNHVTIDAIKTEVRERLEKHGLSKTDNEVDFLAEIWFNQLEKEGPGRWGRSIKSKALRLEIFLAAIGTLIWGFGDLLDVGIGCL